MLNEIGKIMKTSCPINQTITRFKGDIALITQSLRMQGISISKKAIIARIHFLNSIG